MSTPPAARPHRSPWTFAAYLVRRAVLMEVGGYLAILRYVLRRPRVPPGATGFPYAQPVLALLVVFILVSAVELVVVDLLVRRWEAVRLPLLVLGVWGLVFMVGLLLGMLTRPHAVGPAGIRVRSGTEVDIALDWAMVAELTRRSRTLPDGTPKVQRDDAGGAVLHLDVQKATNLEITLRSPVTVRLPHGKETVTRIDLYADDPGGFLQAVTQHRPARA